MKMLIGGICGIIVTVSSGCPLLAACSSTSSVSNPPTASSSSSPTEGATGVSAALTPSTTLSAGISGTGQQPRGTQILSLTGKSSSPVRLPKLPSGTTVILFRVKCQSGFFAVISKDRTLFGGTCSPTAVFSGGVPLRLIDLRDVYWKADSGIGWQLEVWAQ